MVWAPQRRKGRGKGKSRPTVFVARGIMEPLWYAAAPVENGELLIAHAELANASIVIY
jgi:hypothetical protein